MANRTRKAAALPVERNVTAKISYFLDLPGAVFFGDNIASADIDHAAHMQKIRVCFENGGDQDLLWIDCQEMGFESREISQFVSTPAKMTSCGYGIPFALG
jgi:hypothetical protein